MGKRENRRAHAANGVARKPTQHLRLQGQRTAATALSLPWICLHSVWPLYIERRLPVCWGEFFFSVYSCCLLWSVPASLPTELPLACSSALQGCHLSGFFLADGLRSKRDKHKHTIRVTEVTERPSFKSDDGQTSLLRRGHSSSSHSVAHFPPTEAPSPARPSRRSFLSTLSSSTSHTS